MPPTTQSNGACSKKDMVFSRIKHTCEWQHRSRLGEAAGMSWHGLIPSAHPRINGIRAITKIGAARTGARRKWLALVPLGHETPQRTSVRRSGDPSTTMAHQSRW